MKIKVKRKPDTTHAQMKKAGLPNGVVLKKGAWQKAKEADGGIPKLRQVLKGGIHNLGISGAPVDTGTVAEMALARAGGKSSSQVAEEFGVAKGTVAKKVKEAYINSRVGRDVLKGVLLENAIAFGGQAAAKMEEMNGMQSVVATGIMTQRFIDLDKHASSVPDNVDLDEISRVGRELRELEGEIIESSGLGDVIDIGGA